MIMLSSCLISWVFNFLGPSEIKNVKLQVEANPATLL